MYIKIFKSNIKCLMFYYKIMQQIGKDGFLLEKSLKYAAGDWK